MRRVLTLLVAAMLIAAAVFFGLRYAAERVVRGPDPVTIATASLESMHAQNRLVPFAARFVAVVTSKQTRLGLFSTSKTLIMPGLVRYELDLGALRQRDLAWDAASRTLSVTLPPIRIAGPEVQFSAIREYGSGGVLTHFTDAEKQLDQANRRAGEAELLNQARAPLPTRLAREAAVRAVEQSFALPLRAAGVDARVVARFADEGRRSPEQWDVSRPMAEVYREAGGK